MKKLLDIRFVTIVVGLGIFFSWHVDACPVFNSAGGEASGLNDPLSHLLQLNENCPQDVMQLRALIEDEGGKFSTTMVANRGFHNPSQGSFSFFETVEMESPAHLENPIKKDELFFGHFTTPGEGNTLTLDQNPLNSSLMIELIAWDEQSEMYNFYELIGSKQGSKWFFRGNSADIWADTAKLHRARAQGEPVFGSKLRCSGCHIAGGPIMKEISEPHDSWWRSERPLPLAGKTPDGVMQAVMKTLQPPEEIRDQTVAGLGKLLSGKAFKSKQAQSPQIALRPLFCPEEINLDATPWPFDSNVEEVLAPFGFLLDKRLNAYAVTRAPKDLYVEALKKLNSKFPETNRLDGDHAWNSPVKATSDRIAVAALVSAGTIDKEFVADVLAVDMTRPVLSQKRCGLLKFLPNEWSSDWKDKFQNNLRNGATTEDQELLSNLTDKGKDTEFHQNRAQHFIDSCKAQLATEIGVAELVSYLDQARSEISASEISQNPRGQILEPGFRVIFPKFNSLSKPWRLSLSDDCRVK